VGGRWADPIAGEVIAAFCERQAESAYTLRDVRFSLDSRAAVSPMRRDLVRAFRHVGAP
jgi:hypothetical protein